LNIHYNNIKKEQQNNPAFLPFLCFIVAIPVSKGLINVALGWLVLIAILAYKKNKISFSFATFLPVLLYVLMIISYFWSISKPETLKAIPKEIYFLLLPLVFLTIKPFTKLQQDTILKYFSYSIILVALFFIIRALIRYSLNPSVDYFFYHGTDEVDNGLVPKSLNAIYVSMFVFMAYVYFLTQKVKSKTTYVSLVFLMIFLLLLSSKNILIITLLLTIIYFLYQLKHLKSLKYIAFLFVFISVLALWKLDVVKERFLVEWKTNITDKQLYAENKTTYVSVAKAWNGNNFTANDYFTGTAFRILQIRVFKELYQAEPIFWTGYGLNATEKKIEQQIVKHNIHQGYGTFNFHNQYIQIFAELGIFGLLFFVSLNLLNLKNAIKHKNYIHFAFAILMISLFVTESVLARQRGVAFFIAFYSFFNIFNTKTNI